MKVQKRELSWLAVALFGAAAFASALDYGYGTISNIGSAVYPLILSAMIVLVSLYSYIFTSAEPPVPLAARSMAAILGSVILFSLLVERFGIIPAVVVPMLVAYAGQSERGYGFVLGYAVIFAFGTWALFSYALNLPLPTFRMP